jgi:hypothetical protein
MPVDSSRSCSLFVVKNHHRDPSSQHHPRARAAESESACLFSHPRARAAEIESACLFSRDPSSQHHPRVRAAEIESACLFSLFSFSVSVGLSVFSVAGQSGRKCLSFQSPKVPVFSVPVFSVCLFSPGVMDVAVSASDQAFRHHDSGILQSLRSGCTKLSVMPCGWLSMASIRPSGEKRTTWLIIGYGPL